MTTGNELTFYDRATWLAARRTMGIGSSDAPAILGISRYKSAFNLYQEKLGVEPVSSAESEQLEWGLTLEGPIAAAYARETKRPVYNPVEDAGGGNPYVLRRSTTVEFMLAQIDRYTSLPKDPAGTYTETPAIVPLELKNAHFFVGKSWLEEREPPIEFIVQLQHQLAVTGAPWGSIAALIGGCRFVWADMPRDDEFIELLIKAETEFWERLLTRRPPDPDGSSATTRAVNALFRREASGLVVPLEPELLDVHADYQDAKFTIAQAKLRKAAAENKLKMAIGENAAGRLPNGTVYTWRTQNRKEYVSKATSFRVLRCVETKQTQLPPGKRSAALELEAAPEDSFEGGDE